MRLGAIIPARSNSKRLPGKNFLPINGKSLLHRAAQVAHEAALFEEIWVSTDLMPRANMDFCGEIFHFRNPIISEDSVQTAAVVFDWLSALDYKFDAFCVLNPSSPLRTTRLIRDCYSAWKASGADCLMTTSRADGMDFPPRHDGAVLFCKTLPFLSILDFHRMNYADFQTNEASVDINFQAEFDLAEQLLIEREGDSRAVTAGKSL